MRICRILCLGTALVIVPVALAKLPFPNSAFGQVEGILDFCGQADSQSASQYEDRKKVLVREFPEKEVAEVRQSQEYKDGHETMAAELGKLPKEKVIQACSAYLKSDK